MAPFLLATQCWTSYFVSLSLSSLIFKLGMKMIPSFIAVKALLWGLTAEKHWGTNSAASTQETQSSSVFTLRAHEHPSFPSTVSTADRSPPQAQRALFSSSLGMFSPFQMANLNQIENLGQKHAMNGERVPGEIGSGSQLL